MGEEVSHKERGKCGREEWRRKEYIGRYREWQTTPRYSVQITVKQPQSVAQLT